MTKARSRTSTELVLQPSVAYLRMSSDPQEGSIEQQRTELVKLAEKHGYKILREYVDEGKSGSKETEKRIGFLKMIDDSYKREFQVILCWDLQRFGRLDPLKAAAYKDTLRTNGVFLHTCKEGVIKWDHFEEYILDAVYQGAAHEYSKSLSRDTIRGRLDMLARGEYPNGKVPYGYDRLYVSPEGRDYPVKRSETFKKGKGWKRHLVINEEEAKVIRFIFREFVDKDTSMREIARQIKAVRPKGDNQLWTKDTVKATLTNKTYAGFAHIGGLRNRLRAKEAHNRFGYHECAGAVPAIVSLEDYDFSVAKIAKNKEQGRKVHPTKSSPLSGILYCGRCGYALDKHSRCDRNGKRYSYFTCSSSIKRPSTGCKQWRVREDEILPVVIKHLVKEVDRTILESLDARKFQPSEEPNELAHLKTKLAALMKRLEAAEEEALGTPASPKKDRQKAIIRKWEEQQVELERQIHNLTITEGDVTKFAKFWHDLRSQLTSVLPIELGTEEELDESGKATGDKWAVVTYQGVALEDSRLRNLLKSLAFKVTLFWKAQTVVDRSGKTYESGRFHQLDHAEITVGGKHSLASFNNRYTHARTRGKD
jgi:site-specific DNA recombinase